MPPTVLLVEDNPDDVEIARMAFADRSVVPVDLVVASTGERALALLLPDDGTGPLRPVLVLLDLDLPNLNGLDVLRQLRASTLGRCQPVVVLSSSGDERDNINSYRAGANSYVRKAVTLTEFVEEMATLLRYWLCVNAAPAEGQPLKAQGER